MVTPPLGGLFKSADAAEQELADYRLWLQRKYVGSDELELLVLFPGGFAWEVLLNIAVR